MNFTRVDIADQFNGPTFARGDDYVRRGKVVGVRRVNNRIDGEVLGSGGEVYRQRIQVRARHGGVEFDGHCSCPMVRNCKHVVAALLEQVTATTIDEEVARQTAHWLDTAARALVPATLAPAAATTHRLLFVLVPDFNGAPISLHPCKARLRKDGGIGAATIYGSPLTLLNNPPGYLQAGDDDAIRLLAALQAGVFDGRCLVRGRLGAQLLRQLCAEQKLYVALTRDDVGAGKMVQIVPGATRHASLGWQADGDADDPDRVQWLDWRFDDGSAIAEVLPTAPPMYLDAGTLGELVLPAHLAASPIEVLVELVSQAPPLEPDQCAPISARLLDKGLSGVLPLPPTMASRRLDDVMPVPCLFLNHDVHGATAHTDADFAHLSFTYDGVPAPAEDGAELRRVRSGAVEHIARKPAAERAARARLSSFGFAPPKRQAIAHAPAGSVQLPSASHWFNFVRQQLPQLRQAGWQISFGSDYRYDFHEVDDWYAELNEDAEGEGNAWFSLELGILVNGARHALLPLLVQMIRKAPDDFNDAAFAARDDASDLLIELLDGSRVALPWRRIKPLLLILADMYRERDGALLRLPLMDAARLAELEEAAQLRWVGGERLRALGRKLRDFTSIAQSPLPAGLQAQLRPYQHAGLSWMQFLREYQFGGILADDMGLGKTVQTLAHILAEKEAGRLDRPALVVAPTSLMGNWQSEAARFAPSLNVLLVHGKDRAAHFDKIGQADLVLTTYALLGRDEDVLRAHQFHLLILDEAQYIKNSKSRAAQTACLLNARHRLCLTGTPVQNHLGELWSQFHFLMPGFLGKDKEFKADFRKPIELFGDEQAREALTRRIKPFMLRRTKDKVATELPPKTEIHLPVELGAGQRDLYETVRVAMDRKVREEIDRRGLARSQIVILDALLKLRQVCCDPRLLKKAASSAGSAKLDTLMELLDTLMSENRKVLVFSQFTSMLALIIDQLQARSIDFALLTGETIDRAAQVAAFQNGKVNIFLISLKAGGVGLNLTAADTVIHYDPWWNPASENQATDRAWRIGQTQPVFVYKLIATGTLEEKIQEMQKRKGDLANAVLDPAAGLAQGIGAEDLKAIFS